MTTHYDNIAMTTYNNIIMNTDYDNNITKLHHCIVASWILVMIQNMITNNIAMAY